MTEPVKHHHTHILGTVTCAIERVDDLEEKMRHVAKACAFNVVGDAFVQFSPIGATGVLVLAESHFSVHTFPELNYAKLDVYCCSPSFNAAKCVEEIEKTFGQPLSDWVFLSR